MVKSVKCRVVLHIRPKRVDDIETANVTKVHMPDEWIDLIKAYVRANTYKRMNEDSLSAKWQAEYNSSLENFVGWYAGLAKRAGN